ncbi:Y-family DNA polymerase [Beduini massiliensis]|uniref:Y-family DNA polymerase n=1 Tax=Beduini massiliensis TaxID=1585974 RepID=UPI00059A8B66|nr:DNA methylase [Beduini massiliensis]
MKRDHHVYAAIDLKSFYASVECQERGLDPLKTHLVVADSSRTEKTICLAVSPSLKKYGIAGRARLFEVVQKVKEINKQRWKQIGRQPFTGVSYDEEELFENPNLELSYITALPRMSFYIDYSARIYQVYLKYLSPQDIHVYSIDEVFIDITSYLKSSQMTAREFIKRIIIDIFETTGITATAGIGTNLYLCKVAMDIVAKHVRPDEDGVRIAQLDESRYRQYLWCHRPLRDFWRVGRGYTKRLEKLGLYTMGDIARCSLHNEDLLYDEFGINAELLIDHAWGYESCSMKDIKAYQPENQSIGSGQVLSDPYDFEKGRLVVIEMLDQLALDLVDKNLVTDQIILTVGYDKGNLSNKKVRYHGEITTDYYGRKIPKHAHQGINLGILTSSSTLIIEKVLRVYDKIVDRNLYIRRINITANHVKSESMIINQTKMEQMNLFADYETIDKERKKQKEELEKDKRIQQATLTIKKKYGKNAVLKVMDLEEGATAIIRNGTIGGHKA